MDNRMKKEYEEKFRALSEKLDAPEVQARAEAITRANIDKAARVHERLLVRSRELASRRVVR